MVIVGAVLGTLYWALISTSATFRERLQAQGPIEYRVETWEVAWRMIKDNLAFGVGYENFQHFYRRYGYWDVYLRAQPTPHNTFLWVFLMGGLVAFVPFMAFLAAVFFTTLGYFLEARQDANSFPNVELIGTFLASMTVILVPSAVMDSLTGYFNNMIMFLILGAFFGVVSGERRLAAEALRERTRAEHRLATARMEDSRRSATQRSEHALR
jgi:O-antigen ligase